MANAKATIHGWEVTLSREWHNVSGRVWRRDEDWEQVDAKGHVHTYATEDETWERRRVGEYWCFDCRDYHVERETVCVECGDEVRPGGSTVLEHTGIPGPTEITARAGEGARGFDDVWDATQDNPVERLDLGRVVLRSIYPTSRSVVAGGWRRLEAVCLEEPIMAARPTPEDASEEQT